jgi:hypothetical protein
VSYRRAIKLTLEKDHENDGVCQNAATLLRR